MWNKPRELTPYEGNGFEIAAWSSISIDANNALNLWKSSPPHNAVILNQGIWSNYPWSSIGTGIYGNNAVVWFGEEVDSCGYFGGNSCPISFYDVPHGFWAEDYITTIACNGITTGCGGENYCPTQNVNRAQMAAFIIRGLLANGSLAQEPPDNFCGTTNPFPDVLYDHWACKYIKKTSELGITAGYPDGTYRLTNNVTRAEMAVFIVRAVEGDPAAGYCGGVDPFTDVASTHWACGHIKRLLELGISSGYGDSTYKPTQNVNRAQMAVYIGRAFLGMP